MTDGGLRAAAEPLSAADIRLIRLAGFASVAVATTLVLIKLYAWFATGSIAMLGSLADSILDLLASSLTLLAVRFAFEPADREHRFGHGKLEAVAGLAQSVIILGSASYVALHAIPRLVAPVPLTAPATGLGITLVSLMLTLLLVSYQRHVVRRTASVAIGADELHYKADVLTNLAVLAAFAASAWFDWHIVDPILGLIVVGVIVASVLAIVRKALVILLDRELSSASRSEISRIVNSHSAVLGMHDLRTRTSGTHEFIQLHLELRPDMTLNQAHVISEEVEAALVERFPRAEVMIHADPYGIDEPRDEF